MQGYDFRRRFRITRVWAKNFRSIADATLELTPLTVLVGPNASGKSNVLDVLHFLSDAQRTDLEAALSPRHGISGIRRRQRGGRPRNIEIGVQSETREYSFVYSFVITSDSEGGYRVGRERGEIRSVSDEVSSFKFDVRDGNLVSPKSLLSDRSSLADGDTDFESGSLALPAIRRLLIPGSLDNDEYLNWRRALIDLYRGLGSLRFYHIFPNTIREPQKVGSPYPLDEGGHNLASVLREMDKRRPTAMERLKTALHSLIPSVTDLRVVSAGGYLVTQLRHGRTSGGGLSAWFDLTQESDGTVRLLGLLVALYQTPRLPLIGIEEPELTVHPGALMVLADLLQEATRRSQILVTTHSPDLIDRLPVENLKVVNSGQGITTVGPVSETQSEAVRRSLFSPGELHRMEGLEPA